MEFNYITLGFDCSPASALRNLNLREFALPFDWVVSNVNSLERCFIDKFANFHKNLTLNHSKTRLIDYYGFQFPHDYPIEQTEINIKNVGEGVIAEENNKKIVDDWDKYYDIVKEKYDRRIKRFLDIMYDTKPIIALSRYQTSHVYYLLDIFKKVYNKDNIIFINSCKESHISKNVINCDTELNNIWNDTEIWKKYLDIVKKSKLLHESYLIKMEIVNIIIPLYNGVEFLQTAVNSIKNQTYKYWNLTIGVNGHDSNSDTYKKAKSFELLNNLEYGNIFVKLYDTKGKENTCNQMASESKHDTICLLDVDDYWENTKLEKQIQIWKLAKYDVIGTHCNYFGDMKGSPNIPLYEIDPNVVFRVNPLINSSIMIHKKDAVWSNRFKGLDDYDMWLRMTIEGKKFYNIPEKLTWHRVYTGSAFNSSGVQDVPALLEYYKDKIAEKNRNRLRIVTAVVNSIEFIEIQYYTLKKYVKGDYEFIVFNDAKNFPDFTNDGDPTLRSKIEEFCKKLGITCINIPNDHHKTNRDAAMRCADSMNYILRYQLQNPGKYLCIDSDMFLIDTMDSNKYSEYNFCR